MVYSLPPKPPFGFEDARQEIQAAVAKAMSAEEQETTDTLLRQVA